MSVVHRVRLPVGAVPLIDPGHDVAPAEVLATRRVPRGGMSVPVAPALRCTPAEAAEHLRVRPGSMLEAGDVLASAGRRDVRVAEACVFLGYDPGDGSALVAPLGPEEAVIGHVRGEVATVGTDAMEIRVDGALVTGIDGSGDAVHGELLVAVQDPADELRAGAIDVAASGRIVVGGSRASAETLTRARAMGVAGVVLGGALDKELRDFEATLRRRRDVGVDAGAFAILLLSGYGKIAVDPALFAWFVEHDGRMASLFGRDARLYVYDAVPPPGRRGLPRPGDRVLAHRRPYAGLVGELVRELDTSHATASGVIGRAGLVRFEDGRTAVVHLANLEATDPFRGA